MIQDGSCTNPYCKCPNCKCDPCECAPGKPCSCGCKCHLGEEPCVCDCDK